MCVCFGSYIITKLAASEWFRTLFHMGEMLVQMQYVALILVLCFFLIWNFIITYNINNHKNREK